MQQKLIYLGTIHGRVSMAIFQNLTICLRSLSLKSNNNHVMSESWKMTLHKRKMGGREERTRRLNACFLEYTVENGSEPKLWWTEASFPFASVHHDFDFNVVFYRVSKRALNVPNLQGQWNSHSLTCGSLLWFCHLCLWCSMVEAGLKLQ